MCNPIEQSSMISIRTSSLYISESMQDIGSGTFPVALGDWSRAYLIVAYNQMAVITDPYTTKGQTYLYFSRRYGGDILNDEAVKLLKVATS